MSSVIVSCRAPKRTPETTDQLHHHTAKPWGKATPLVQNAPGSAPDLCNGPIDWTARQGDPSSRFLSGGGSYFFYDSQKFRGTAFPQRLFSNVIKLLIRRMHDRGMSVASSDWSLHHQT